MNILIKPIVTEKMTAQGEDFNRYGFVVAKDANKLQIKQAVEDLYDVKVAEKQPTYKNFLASISNISR